MDRKQADSLGDGAGKVEGLSQKAEKEFMDTDNSGVIAQPGQGCGGGRKQKYNNIIITRKASTKGNMVCSVRRQNNLAG